MGLSKLGNLWLFIVGNFAGGALAAIIYKLVNQED
jgi:glycerol uptake facilitator-like aquaporin